MCWYLSIKVKTFFTSNFLGKHFHYQVVSIDTFTMSTSYVHGELSLCQPLVVGTFTGLQRTRICILADPLSLLWVTPCCILMSLHHSLTHLIHSMDSFLYLLRCCIQVKVSRTIQPKEKAQLEEDFLWSHTEFGMWICERHDRPTARTDEPIPKTDDHQLSLTLRNAHFMAGR